MMFFVRNILVGLLYLSASLSLFAERTLNTEIVCEMESILGNLKKSHYVHESYINEFEGVYDLNCSLLATYVLSKVAPEALLSVPVELFASYPRAALYYQAFSMAEAPEGLMGWGFVEFMYELEPGDLIAWTAPLVKRDRNSGHVMFVYEKPLFKGDGSVEVKVFDSTKGSHFEDQRKGGVGVGTIRFLVDEEGRPIAHFFSPRQKKAIFRNILMCRALDPFASLHDHLME